MHIFIHNQNKINPEITMKCLNNNDVLVATIGNLFNLIDYLNDSVMFNEVVIFQNFTGDQIDYVIKSISFKKEIDRVEAYNAFAISSRRHIKINARTK